MAVAYAGARGSAVVDEERIAEAERSLRHMLEVESLEGRTFLDIGCGSGLFSLAALRLGAARVHSFDFDGDSDACARELAGPSACSRSGQASRSRVMRVRH